MNLANKISVVRMFLVPVYIVLLLFPEGNRTFLSYEGIMVIATIVFVVASLTDALDGYVARKYNLISNFGKFFDPLVDKLLTCSAFIALVSLDRLPAWAAIIIVSREIIISGLRALAAEAGVVIAADKLGKLKTIIQMVCITFLTLLPIFYFQPMVPAMTGLLVLITVIITVSSGLDYLIKNRSLLNDF